MMSTPFVLRNLSGTLGRHFFPNLELGEIFFGCGLLFLGVVNGISSKVTT